MEVLPQLNYENKMHFDLKMRVKRFLMVGDVSTSTMTMGFSAHQASKMTVKKK